MSSFDAINNVAASGMAAQRLRVQLAAANIANSETTRTPEGGPYRKKDPIFQVAALGEGRFQDFLDLVRESSLSSFMWLQNIISPSHVGSQGVTVALAITERYIKDHGSRGACRIHGAGFAGTIQAWIPRELVNSYKATIEPFFVPGCVQVLNIRTTGAARF